MMVDDDDVDATSPRNGKCFMARRAAVDGDNELGAIVDQLFDRRRIRPVALENPIGNVNLRVDAKVTEEPGHERRRRGTVDVVVAEDHDLFTPLDGRRETIGGLAAIGERIRIRHQRPKRRIEEARGIVEHDPAAGKHATKEIGITVDLTDGERPVLARLVKP